MSNQPPPPQRKYSLPEGHPDREGDRPPDRGRKSSVFIPPTTPPLEPPPRRFSILNPFVGGGGERKRSVDTQEFTDYEVVESAFCLPPDFGRVDASQHAKQLKDFFDRLSGDSVDGDNALDWESPESWGVLPPPKQPTANAALVDNPECEELWVIRVFRPETPRRLSTTNVPVLDNAGLDYVTASGPLDTIVADLYPALARKFFGCADVGRYRLFVQHAGLETMLSDDAMPFMMQKGWFEEIGYRGRGEVNGAVSQEHSYVCRYALKELPAAGRQRGSSASALDVERLTERFALLGNLNLSVVPVDLFLYSQSLQTLDLSRNTLLHLPDDLFGRLITLRLLILRQNLLETIPPAIFSAPSITNLDLSGNKLDRSAIAALHKLPGLVSLTLSGNRISSLPGELAALSSLRSLVLSSNSIEHFDPVLFELPALQELDLSFNLLQQVPDGISGLKQLQCLVLTGNSLNSISSAIQKCASLRSVDVRGNLLSDISSLASCSSLLDLRADYNLLNRLDDVKWPRMVELSVSRNSLCQVSFAESMPHLRILDVSANRLGLLPEPFFDDCKSLEYLNLSDNQLTAIPESVNRLSKLVKLCIANNQLTDCNLSFPQLKRLKILDLHGNNLKKLPGDFWLSESLAIANLSSNFISSLPTQPPGPAPLRDVLEELYLGENQCRNEVFEQLSGCRELRVLNLAMNDIYDLPGGFPGFDRLRELYLSHNQLTALPDDINKLANLRILFVNNNRLSSLPGELCHCNELQVLEVSSNSLRYNVTNVPYDWNWRFNANLSFLSLADNPKLDLTSQQHELASFRGLQSLKSLNIAGLRFRSDSLPDDSISVRVRTAWSASPDFPLKVGVAEWCGRRRRFDVFDVSIGRVISDQMSLFGVFDGKGSSNVSSYLFRYFVSNLLQSADNLRSEEPLTDTHLSDALRLAFLSSNADLSTQPTELRAGSTATVCLLSSRRLMSANVGDSTAVLSREGRAIELTTRHQAWNRGEMDRLRGRGGHISGGGRVEGEMEWTRAIGHLHLLPLICADPSIRTVDLTDADEFVIIGSGSLWRAISTQTAVDLVRKVGDDYSLAAQRIRDLAISYSVNPDESILVAVFGLKGVRRQSLEPAIPQPPLLVSSGSISRGRLRLREDVPDSTLARLPREIDPPTGTLAMAFTDIRDSTVLWETLTAPMRVAKKQHHMIMRRALRMLGGYEVKTEGDAFMVAFPDAQTAAKWCLTVQLDLLEADWPPELLQSPICGPQYSDDGKLLYRGLSVRMGVHYGGGMEGEQDTVTGRMDYNGVPVIIASRVQSLAKGGQILITEAVKRSIEEHSEGISAEIIDAGWVRLKGIEAGEHVYAVYPTGLVARYTGPPDGSQPSIVSPSSVPSRQ